METPSNIMGNHFGHEAYPQTTEPRQRHPSAEPDAPGSKAYKPPDNTWEKPVPIDLKEHHEKARKEWIEGCEREYERLWGSKNKRRHEEM